MAKILFAHARRQARTHAHTDRQADRHARARTYTINIFAIYMFVCFILSNRV